MDRFLKTVLYAIPMLAFAGLVLFVFFPQLADTGPSALLKASIRAGGDFPCPQYDSLREHVISGGPPKDGIPAIGDAHYHDAEDAELADTDRVFGVIYEDFIAAYPESIMVWHQVVNQEVNDRQLSITYCPLAHAAAGFVGFNLGVTGKLYNSNLIMYDRMTQSQIVQISGLAVDGELCGTALQTFPVKATTWGDWKKRFPQTLVMTTDTGYKRDYETDPYDKYNASPEVLFPLTASSDALPPKSMVLGLVHGDDSAAVPLDGFLEKHPEGLSLELGGKTVTVWYDDALHTLQANPEVRQTTAYWFAWFAQYPNTTLQQ